MAGKFVPVCAEFPLATFPAKNFNKASYKNSRQNIIKQHPVQKELKSNHQFSFTPIKSQIIPENTIWYSNQFFSYDFTSLHKMMCKSSERKSIMARYRATDQIYLIYLQYCEQFPNLKFVCKSNSLFCKFISCRDDFLFGVKDL